MSPAATCVFSLVQNLVPRIILPDWFLRSLLKHDSAVNKCAASYCGFRTLPLRNLQCREWQESYCDEGVVAVTEGTAGAGFSRTRIGSRGKVNVPPASSITFT